MFILHNSNNTSVQKVIPVDFPVENSCSQTLSVNIALCACVLLCVLIGCGAQRKMRACVDTVLLGKRIHIYWESHV